MAFLWYQSSFQLVLVLWISRSFCVFRSFYSF
nr:MAG TPA: hypothetical protein [Caudoviricetes sp.]